MRRDRSVGFLLTRAFVVLVSLIVCSGLVETAAVLQQHRVVRALTSHVQPLRLANAELRGVLADAQLGVRGYSLTGDAEMLGAFRSALLDYALVGRALRSMAGEDEAPAVDEQLARADTWFDVAELQSRAPPRSAAALRYAARPGRSSWPSWPRTGSSTPTSPSAPRSCRASASGWVARRSWCCWR